MVMADYTDADLIAFTDVRFVRAGAKDKAIRDRFGLTNTRFWQQVLAVLADPQRVAALPAELGPVVNRLKRRIAA